MKNILSQYFENDRIILLDRAFLGLFSLFINIKAKNRGRKILFTSTTCPSPVFAAVYAGFQPIFSDINLDNFLMDLNQSKNIMNEDDEIACIVYIYTFGHTSDDVFELKEIAKNKGIYFIEDVAQAFGAMVNGKKAGTIGDASVMSFGYSKQIDCGSGGALLINSDILNKEEIEYELRNIKRYDFNNTLSNEYKEEFYRIRDEGLKDPINYNKYKMFTDKYKELYFRKITLNWDMIENKIFDFIQNDDKFARNQKAFYYYKRLSQGVSAKNLILLEPREEYSTYRFTFLVKAKEDTKEITEILRKNNINCSNLYIPVSRIFFESNFDKAVYFSERVINLWVDKEATEEYLQTTVKLINNYFEKKSRCQNETY